MNQSKHSYERFRIPPDFRQAKLHAQACVPYAGDSQIVKQCPCCSRVVGDKRLPLCSSVGSLRVMGQQMPVFFRFLFATMLSMVILTFVILGEFMFVCDECTYSFLILPQNIADVQIIVGYQQNRSLVFMIQLIVISCFLFFIKFTMKTTKYHVKRMNNSISRKSLMLTNIHKKTTEADVHQLFARYGFTLKDVTFTYKVKQHWEVLEKISKLKKQRDLIQYYHHKPQEELYLLIKKITEKRARLNQIKRSIVNSQNRLQICFVQFNSIQQRDIALYRFTYSLPRKLLYKLCPAFSQIQINEQHISIGQAPDPQDINWRNLEVSYFRGKITSLVSYFVCFTLIGIGLVFEIYITRLQNDIVELDSFYIQVIKTGSVIVCNFIIVNFISWMSRSFEKTQTQSQKILSVMRKLTFFLFINISASPLFKYIYLQLKNPDIIGNTNLDQMILSVITVSAGNLLKPFITCFSVQRILKWFKQRFQLCNGNTSELNQSQANSLFEPLEFPIQNFYSEVISSLMMCFFYMSVVQSLFIFQCIGLVLVYIVAKIMMIRMCKQPVGLSVKISNLAQTMLRFVIPLAWVGRNLIYLFLENKDSDFYSVIWYFFWRDGDVFNLVSLGLAIFMFFAQPIISCTAKRVVAVESISSQDEILLNQQQNLNRLGYRQANLFDKLKKEHINMNNKSVMKWQQFAINRRN